MPKVSVIIPVYNVEKYLKECLDSLVNQTLPDIEIILVDDGSTDSSLDICKQYAQKDNRIKIIEQQNQGAGAARNKGLAVAIGDYLYFMDSDDYINTNALEKLYNQITKTNADICFCKHKIFDEKDKIIKNGEWDSKIKIIPEMLTFSYKDIPTKILQICIPTPFIKLYKKSFINRKEISFQEIKTCNDVFFCYASLIMADKITFINEFLVTYRTNQKTSLSSNRGRSATCIITAYTKLKEYLNNNRLFDIVSKSVYDMAVANFKYELGHCNPKRKKELLKQIKSFLPSNYYKKHFQNKLLQQIFSLKNEDIHKVITVLGFKFKIKSNALICKHKIEQKTKQLESSFEYKLCKYLPAEKYPEYLKDWFYRRTGEELNLENPQTFNEKIQWLKLYDSTPLKTKLADKYLVRDWVKEKIGEEYLIPLLGVWENFDDIDFDKLPDKFVLKANHGSAWNIIVTDKNSFDKKSAKQKFDKWLHTDYSIKSFELHYKNIKPLIIAEEYIEADDGDLKDYKFNFSPCAKPYNFEKMLKFANIMSKGFPFVRVDFYENDNKLYFGEMTFTSASGTHIFTPDVFNLELGKLIDLSLVKKED